MKTKRVFNQIKHEVVKQKYQNYLLHFDHSWQENPEACLHFKELESKVNSLLARLPDQQRNIFEMSRMKGLSSSKIAEDPGLSVRNLLIPANCCQSISDRVFVLPGGNFFKK